MKLRNKKTGEIADLSEGFIRDTYCGEMIEIKPVAISNKQGYVYGSLTEFNEEWEDYEEPKTEFYITAWGDIREYTTKEERFAFKQKLEIGNYFSSREEAEQAVEKLKAWKRLKDNGFRFDKHLFEYDELRGIIHYQTNRYDGIEQDLDLLFGGEE